MFHHVSLFDLDLRLVFVEREPEANALALDDHELQVALQSVEVWLTAEPSEPEALLRDDNPFARWARQTRGNMRWLERFYAVALVEQARRFDDRSIAQAWSRVAANARATPTTLQTQQVSMPPLCVPGGLEPSREIYSDNIARVIAGHRLFYAHERSIACGWTRCDPPSWWERTLARDARIRLGPHCGAVDCRGWIHACSDQHGFQIERCDECGVFGDDDEARAVHREECVGCLYESDDGVDRNEEPRQGKLREDLL